MSDSFTEVTRTSYGSRLKNAIGGILVGLVLIIGGIWLLSWNEGRTIKNKKALQEGASAVISIDSIGFTSELEGKLVHTTGTAITEDVLSDIEFGVKANAIHLKRKVEMYQWIEKSETKTEKKVGGAEEKKKTYTYSKKWSSSHHSSADFKIPEGHQNPSEFSYKSESYSAANVTLKDFVLSESIISKIGGFSTLDISDINVSAIANAKLSSNKVYVGLGNDQGPQVGDMRIAFDVVNPKVISVIAKQNNNHLVPYVSSNGKTITLVNIGVASADQMFAEALQSNKVMGWILRLVGVIMLIIGFNLIFRPFVVLADILPILGRVVGAGTGFISFILGLSIGLVTIAIAWIAYRPFVAIPLLAVVLFLIVVAIMRSRKKRLAAG
jgi:hypothetical protein